MAAKISNIELINKKANFNYILLDKYTCGIMLSGTEVKAIRAGKINLSDAYCYFIKEELWIKNLHISEYEFGTYNNHVPLRNRKLLLQRRELNKIHTKLKEKGLTLIPYRIFFNERNICKLDIYLAKGKKSFDKRETIKARDTQKDIERLKKKFK